MIGRAVPAAGQEPDEQSPPVFWIRAALGGVGFGMAVACYIVLRILPMPMTRRRQWFARAMSHLCCPPVGLRLTYHDVARMRVDGPCVYVCNHQSQLDYPILGRIYPGRALVIASQIGDWPIMGALYRGSGSLVLDRDVPHRAGTTFQEAERAIRDQNASIWIFAEGTRGSQPGKLGPFKRGAFRLAVRTGVPIVPIVVSPLKPRTDLRGRRLLPNDVTVRVLDPVYPAGTTEEDENALRHEVRALMQRTLTS